MKPTLLVFLLFTHHCFFAQQPEVIFPKRHKSGTKEIKLVVLPDSSRFITYGDNSPLIWDLKLGAPVTRLEGHYGNVQKIVLKKDIYSCDGSGIIRWNTDGKQIGQYQGGPIYDFDISRGYIACGGFEKIFVIDLATGAKRTIEELGYNEFGTFVRFTPDGKFLLLLKSGSSNSSVLVAGDPDLPDSTISIYETTAWKQVATVEAVGGIDRIEFDNRDRIYLYTLRQDLKIFDISSPLTPKDITPVVFRNELRNFDDPDEAAIFSYDINDFAPDTLNNTIVMRRGFSENFIIYNFGSQKLTRVVQKDGGKFCVINGMIFIRDPSIDSLYVINGTSLKEHGKIKAYRVYHSDSKKIVSGDYDHQLSLYWPGDLSLIRTLQPTLAQPSYISHFANNTITQVRGNELTRINLTTLTKSNSNLGRFSSQKHYIDLPLHRAVFFGQSKYSMEPAMVGYGEGTIKEYPRQNSGDVTLVMADKAERLVFGLKKDTVKVFDLETMQVLYDHVQPAINYFYSKGRRRVNDPTTRRVFYPLTVTDDGKYFAVSVNDTLIHFRETASNRLVKAIEIADSTEFETFRFIPGTYDLLYIDHYMNMVRYSFPSGDIMYEKDIDDGFESIIGDLKFLDNGNKIVIPTDLGMIVVYDIATGKKLYRLDPKFISDMKSRVSRDEKKILTWDTDAITLWNIRDSLVLLNIQTGLKNISECFLDSSDNRIIVLTEENIIRIYDARNGEVLITISNMEGQDIFSFTPGLYYYATRNAARSFYFRLNNKIYPFDQFDLKYNRPDLVFRHMGDSDSARTRGYYSAWLKRMRRAGLEVEKVDGQNAVPKLEISNGSGVSFISSATILDLKIKASDNLQTLNRLHIKVNGNPIYGERGLELATKKTLDTTVSITKSSGRNRIQVSVTNKKGFESLRETIETILPGKTSGKIYFFGIGISKYKDTTHNLVYADKDINDLAAAIKRIYPDAEINYLLNGDATLENIKGLKKLLLQTNTDDKIIFSFSGHGLVDDQQDFYYANHDIDFSNPSGTGLRYDDISWLLDSIPARNRLVLMDACHSGELDTEIDKKMIGEQVRVVKGQKGLGRKQGAQTNFELMQDLFSNLSYGNGATFISAAAGNEFAFEGMNHVTNGVFTHCLLQGLVENKADLNIDGKITVSELQEYVSSKVKELTEGRQRPTSRQINLDNDWVLKEVRE